MVEEMVPSQSEATPPKYLHLHLLPCVFLLIPPPIFLRKKHSYLHPTYFATPQSHWAISQSLCVYAHTYTEAFLHILIHTYIMCPSC